MSRRWEISKRGPLPLIGGYIVVWDSPTSCHDGQRYVFRRGCFDSELSPSLEVLVKHERVHHLQDTPSNRRVYLESDDYGLWIEAELINSSEARAILSQVYQGTLRHWSIGFQPVEFERFFPVQVANGLPLTIVKDGMLAEVSITDKPALKTTEARCLPIVSNRYTRLRRIARRVEQSPEQSRRLTNYLTRCRMKWLGIPTDAIKQREKELELCLSILGQPRRNTFRWSSVVPT